MAAPPAGPWHEACLEQGRTRTHGVRRIMLQMPFLNAGLSKPGSDAAALAGAAGSNRLPAGAAIGGLLGDDAAMQLAFSAELQAMLMQLSPGMLQRLDTMLADGMSLPQAARSLLAEGVEGGDRALFAQLLRDGQGGGPRLPAGVFTDPPAVDAATPRSPTPPLPVLPAGDPRQIPVPQAADAATAVASALAGSTPTALPQQVATSLLHMAVPQEVGGRDWSGAIADRVMWMVQGDQQFARLHLNPPNLGPLEIRVSLSQDQATVAFVAQHAAVRDALETALPRLREMFDQQSLQLVRADVSDPGTPRDGQPEQSPVGPGSGRHAWGDDPDMPTDPDNAAGAQRTLTGQGLIDLFA